MKQIIEITRDNLDQIAKGLAASINRLGFRKNGKEMVASQAIRVLAERQGMNEHQFIKSLKSNTKADPKAQERDDTVPVEEHSVSVAQAPEPTMTPLELRWDHEHGWYGRDEWREDVTRGITHLSYWMWVQQSIERNGGDEEHCSDCGKPLDGESWDGKCGDCADRETAEDDLQNEAASRGINLADVQRQAADAAFEAYDFGEDLTVADHEGWEWCSGDSIMTKKVFLEDLRTPEEPSRLVKFVVNVVNGVVTDISVNS